MGRRTHPPRAAAFVAAAIVFSVTVLGTTSASAAVPTVTRTVTPTDPNGSNGWYNSGTIDVTSRSTS